MHYARGLRGVQMRERKAGIAYRGYPSKWCRSMNKLGMYSVREHCGATAPFFLLAKNGAFPY